MQQIREGLAARLGRPASAVHIASYPVGPNWKHTYWWREGETEYAEAQFFARIAEEFPVLSVGVSVEKGLEDADAVPSERREAFLMDRRTWDWQRLKSRIRDVVKTDVPACASLLARPVELRFSASQYARGQTTGMHDGSAFVFLGGAWFRRHVGTATESDIADRLRDLDGRKDWWVNAYFGCDLFPHEVDGMTTDTLVSILWKCAAIRRRLTSRKA